MSFCCDALKTSFKKGFCRIRALKGDESEGGVRFGIVMGMGDTEMVHCPFCGSIKIVELSFDDEGNELDEWMMTDANRESESEGLPGFESWEEFVEANAYIHQVQCTDCNAGVISKKSIEDAWVKWNRRVQE